MYTIGVYAGSFDPPTHGHLWAIEQGIGLFDEFAVLVASNANKRYTFDAEERKRLLHESILLRARDIPLIQEAVDAGRVRVDVFENGFVMDWAQKHGATHLLRGLRSPQDFSDEYTIRHINEDIGMLRGKDEYVIPESVYIIPPLNLSVISSSNVKGLMVAEGWEEVVAEYVPAPVFDALLRLQDKRNSL